MDGFSPSGTRNNLSKIDEETPWRFPAEQGAAWADTESVRERTTELFFESESGKIWFISMHAWQHNPVDLLVS